MSGRTWQVFTAAPHRVMFLGGAVQLVLPLLWWTAELWGRATGAWQLPPPVIGALWTHVYLMLFTPFVFFMFGFLMTTYPRWMNGTVVPPRRYVPAFLLLLAGVVCVWAGVFLSRPLVILGMALHLAGWGLGFAALLAVYREVKGRADRRYETHLNVALACGWLGELLYLAWAVTGEGALAYLGLRTALWLFLIPVLVVVGHRMIPYFSSVVIEGYRVVQPPWALGGLWAGCAGHLLLETIGRFDLTWMADLPLAAIGLYLTLQWRLRASLGVRLLAVLHIAFAWFAIGTLAYAAQSLWLFAGGDFVLGRGPLHALTIGFIASMVVAMATRVSQGHSGRPLVMDTFGWLCFLGVQATALLRLFGDLAGAHGTLLLPHLNLMAALLWLLALTPWAVRYGRIYLTPRADGRHG